MAAESWTRPRKPLITVHDGQSRRQHPHPPAETGKVERSQCYLKRLSKHIVSPGPIWSRATLDLLGEKMAIRDWDIICQDTAC